jgi:antitoxin VapB
MTKSTVFKSNETQAVRLPKAVALPDHVKTVEIIKQGNARLILPAGGSWQAFFDGPRLDRAGPVYLNRFPGFISEVSAIV